MMEAINAVNAWSTFMALNGHRGIFAVKSSHSVMVKLPNKQKLMLFLWTAKLQQLIWSLYGCEQTANSKWIEDISSLNENLMIVTKTKLTVSNNCTQQPGEVTTHQQLGWNPSHSWSLAVTARIMEAIRFKAFHLPPYSSWWSACPCLSQCVSLTECMCVTCQPAEWPCDVIGA